MYAPLVPTRNESGSGAADDEGDSAVSIAVADAVEAYIDRKAVGESTGGTYANNATSILMRWADWLQSAHDLETLENIEQHHLQSYAADLTSRTEAGEYTASTAHTYFAVVRAFCSWCVEGGLLEDNPATGDEVHAALPEIPESASDGSWTPEQRRELEAHVRQRAADADEDDRSERLAALRDYALVAILAHAGVRGAELFRVPEDERRGGATWDDVDLYAGTIRVLGTSQRLEEVPLPAAARTPLRRYRVILDPPTNDWPLFPTRHAPSIANRVRAALAERGFDEEEIEALMADATATEVARDRAIPPPAITTEGARSILRRLCDEAGIDLEGEYLTPRGARLGADARDRAVATPAPPALRTTADQSMAPLEDEDSS